MNVVSLIGNLTRDPELTQTPNGTSVCKFTLAINDGYGDKKKVYYIPCVAWKGTGETISKYNQKGTRLGVVGRLTQRTWDDKEGNKRTTFEVVVTDFHLLGNRGETSNDGGHEKSDNRPAKTQSAPPAKGNSFDDDDNSFDDSDIPF